MTTNSNSSPVKENERPENEDLVSSSDENDDVNGNTELAVGATFQNLDDVYSLYCEYGRMVGFSVKKGTQAYFKGTLIIRQKVFLCSCEGHADTKCRAERLPAFRKQVHRTNCKARVRVFRTEEGGLWTVSVFMDEHNHELIPQPNSYLLRSARNMTLAKSTLLESFLKSGIGVAQAHRFMVKEAGGVNNVGFLIKDAYNHMDKLNQSKRVVDGDAKALLELDDEGRLLAFYFRDVRCLVDYEYFGDVLSVDTTYRTNKYHLFCLPFIGINHHGNNIMFGIGFLSSETTESFEWIFKTFLDSMNGREPQIIFSDQSQALMNGIDNTFRTASPRLCQWHINRNAASRFRDKDFKRIWDGLMNGCETEDEFDLLWEKMKQSYPEATSSGWFTTMHNLRKHWSSVFTNTKFTGGLHTTARSEATNRVFKQLCSASTKLSDFVDSYDQIQNEWRVAEEAEDVANRGIPGFIMNNRFLTHVGEIYTRNILKLYEHEAMLSFDVEFVGNPDFSALELQYKISAYPGSKRHRTVHFNQTTKLAKCSCRMWETDGILCRHILKGYYVCSVHRLPDDLVLHRWTKDAKKRITDESLMCSLGCGEKNREKNHSFISRNLRLLMDLTYQCQDDEDCVRDVDGVIDELVSRVKTRLRKKTEIGSQEQQTPKRFRDPKLPDRKNGDKRYCHQFDSPKSTRARVPKKTAANTSCSQTPNSRRQPSVTHSPTVSTSVDRSDSLNASGSFYEHGLGTSSPSISAYESIPMNTRRAVLEDSVFYFKPWTRDAETSVLEKLEVELLYGWKPKNEAQTLSILLKVQHYMLYNQRMDVPLPHYELKFKEWHKRSADFSELISHPDVVYDGKANFVHASVGFWEAVAQRRPELCVYMNEGEVNWKLMKAIFSECVQGNPTVGEQLMPNRSTVGN